MMKGNAGGVEHKKTMVNHCWKYFIQQNMGSAITALKNIIWLLSLMCLNFKVARFEFFQVVSGNKKGQDHFFPE